MRILGIQFLAAVALALGSCSASADEGSSQVARALVPTDARSAESGAKFDGVGARARDRSGPESRSPAPSSTFTVRTLVQTATSSTFYADAAGLGGGGLSDNARSVGKVGVEFKVAQATWNIAHGGVDARLDDNSRISLRARRGGLGVILRTSFK